MHFCEPVCVIATSQVNAEITDGSITPALCAMAGTGGNNCPLVVLKMDETDGIEMHRELATLPNVYDADHRD